MKCYTHLRLRALALAALLLAFAPAAGAAELGAGGGAFVPWNGSGGFAVGGQLLRSGERTRFGVELQYREFEATFFDVDDVPVQSIGVGAVFHYLLRTEGRLRPYLGASLGMAVNLIDEDAVEAGLPPGSEVVLGAGIGLGGSGIAGLDIGLTDRLSLYAEARAGVQFQLTTTEGGGDEGLDVENLGGFQGLGGLRLRF